MRKHTLPGHIGAEVAFANRSLFLRDTSFDRIGAGGYSRRYFRFAPVKHPGRVWARGHAKTASDTPVAIDGYDTVLAFKRCVNRAYFNAGRLVAMHTGRRFPIWSGIFGAFHGLNLYPVLARVQLMGMVTGFLAFF